MTRSPQVSTRDAVLDLLVERGELDAGQLANTLGITVQAMRRHLRSLADAGLIEASTSINGPGRPSNRWCLTTEGRDRFPNTADRFAIGLLDSMRACLPETTLKALLDQQAEQKAAAYRAQLGDVSLAERLETLVALRREEGYVTICSKDADGISWLLQEMHCSVQRIAEEFPAICDQELLLIRRTVQDCNVERVHWRLEGGHACGFRITPLEA